MAESPFDLSFDPVYGEAAAVTPLVRRITARNPSPFTFRGTNTHIVGRGRVAVIDPGPDDPAHLQALLAALGREEVSHILVTHTHRDHSPGAAALKAATGAVVLAAGPHGSRSGLAVEGLEAGADRAFAPDEAIRDGAILAGDGWTIEAVFTPGHSANHMSFALREETLLFSGDHVMGWSTTIVAPPDGHMADYMASLRRLLGRPERLYLSAHGAPIADGPKLVEHLVRHRQAREAAILEQVRRGEDSLERIVRTVYADLDPRLRPAASLSALAHLEHLVEQGLVIPSGPLGLETRFAPSRSPAPRSWS